MLSACSNTANHLKHISFLEMIIKRHCIDKEQDISDFFSLKAGQTLYLCVYLNPGPHAVLEDPTKL